MKHLCKFGANHKNSSNCSICPNRMNCKACIGNCKKCIFGITTICKRGHSKVKKRFPSLEINWGIFYIFLNTPLTFPSILQFGTIIGSIVEFSGCKRIWSFSL